MDNGVIHGGKSWEERINFLPSGEKEQYLSLLKSNKIKRSILWTILMVFFLSISLSILNYYNYWAPNSLFYNSSIGWIVVLLISIFLGFLEGGKNSPRIYMNIWKRILHEDPYYNGIRLNLQNRKGLENITDELSLFHYLTHKGYYSDKFLNFLTHYHSNNSWNISFFADLLEIEDRSYREIQRSKLSIYYKLSFNAQNIISVYLVIMLIPFFYLFVIDYMWFGNFPNIDRMGVLMGYMMLIIPIIVFVAVMNSKYSHIEKSIFRKIFEKKEIILDDNDFENFINPIVDYYNEYFEILISG